MKFWNRRNEILFTIRGETDASQDVIYNNTESGQDGNVMPKLNLFQVEYTDQIEPVIFSSSFFCK